MQAVNVSLRVSTMSVLAALLTASPLAPAEPGPETSRSATVRANSPNPSIITIVAAAAGIESLRIDHVIVRETLAHRIGRKSWRTNPAYRPMIARPIQV